MKYLLLIMSALVFVACARTEEFKLPIRIMAMDIDSGHEIQGGVITYKYELPSEGVPWFDWGPSQYKIDTIQILPDQTIYSSKLFNVECKSLVSFHHNDYKTMVYYSYICLDEAEQGLMFECKKKNTAKVTFHSNDTLRFFKMRNIIYPDSLGYRREQTLGIDEFLYEKKDSPGIIDTTFYLDMLPGMINRIFITYRKHGVNGTFEMNSEMVPEYRDTFDLEFVLE